MLKIIFDLTDFEEVELIPVADCHIGNPLSDIQALHDLISYVNQEPEDPKCARICLLNGDLTESVTRKSVGDPFSMTMTPSVQVATMIQMLKPLAEPREHYPMGKILSYCSGNHDEGRYKDTGISAAESIAVGLALDDRYSPDGCYSFVKLKRINDKSKSPIATVNIYNTHMTGGGSTVGGKANRASKLGINGGIIADLCIGSHVHQPISFKEDILVPNNNVTSLVQKTVTYLVTNAFLRYGDYAQRAGMKPATIEVPKVYIKQDRYGRDSRRFIKVEVRL